MRDPGQYDAMMLDANRSLPEMWEKEEVENVNNYGVVSESFSHKDTKISIKPIPYDDTYSSVIGGLP